jgi:hypothetical protein
MSLGRPSAAKRESKPPAAASETPPAEPQSTEAVASRLADRITELVHQAHSSAGQDQVIVVGMQPGEHESLAEDLQQADLQKEQKIRAAKSAAVQNRPHGTENPEAKSVALSASAASKRAPLPKKTTGPKQKS